MTDIQILTLILTLLSIFAASWFNNSRFGDLGNLLGKRIEDLRDVLRAEMKAERAENNARFDRLDTKLDIITKLCVELENRTSKLEERR